jgi:hypothetical protein
VQHFGGCEAYLETWEEINRCADQLEETKPAKGDVEEAQLFLNGVIQTSLLRLFVDDDGKPLVRTVRSATLKT